MKTKSLSSLWVLLGLLTFSSYASAWSASGHMMMAAIAEPRLNQHAEQQIKKLLDIKLPMDYASKDFIHASHWADDVRSLSEYDYAKPMHYVDYPFSSDKTPLPNGFPNEINIVNALKRYVEILKDQGSDTKRAEALRFIIHFVGDIHQPLHCTSRVTQDKPLGDKGGNEFYLRIEDDEGRSKRIKLHAYWDGGIKTFPKMGEGFSLPPLIEIKRAALKISQTNPDSNLGWKEGGEMGFDAWAKESHELALTVAYLGIEEGSSPNQAYIDKAIQTANQRIAWSGYRLAALLNAIWP